MIACFMLALVLATPADTARLHARRAQAALDAGDGAQAVAWWQAAVAVDASPAARLGLAEALAAREGTCGEAGEAFAAAAAGCAAACDGGAAGCAADCSAVEAARAAAARRCEVAVTVESRPGGARLAVDDRPWTGGAVWAGTHRFSAIWPDGTARVQFACLTPGTPAQITIAQDGRMAVDPTVPAEHRALAHQEAAFAHVERQAACAAVAEFQAAHAARPDPSFIYNEAMANALDLRRCGAAIAALDRFVAACPDCPQVWAARSKRGELAAGCRGVLAVRLPVPDATVWVDGELSPARSERLPGTYAVMVQAPGFHPATVPAPVETGETRTVELALMPVLAPPTPGPPPVGSAALPALPPEPVDAPRRDRTWLVVAVGVGAAGLVAGGAFTALAADDRDTFVVVERQARLDGSQSYRETLRGHLDAFVFDRAMAVVGWTVGGAGLTAAAVLWWLEVPVPVQAGPGGVGFGWEF